MRKTFGKTKTCQWWKFHFLHQKCQLMLMSFNFWSFAIWIFCKFVVSHSSRDGDDNGIVPRNDLAFNVQKLPATTSKTCLRNSLSLTWNNICFQMKKHCKGFAITLFNIPDQSLKKQNTANHFPFPLPPSPLSKFHLKRKEECCVTIPLLTNSFLMAMNLHNSSCSPPYIGLDLQIYIPWSVVSPKGITEAVTNSTHHFSSSGTTSTKLNNIISSLASCALCQCHDPQC